MSQHLRNSCEAVPIVDVLSKKGQKVRPQRSTPSTSDVSMDGPREVSPPESSTKYSTSHHNVSHLSFNFPGNNIEKSVDLSYSMEHEHNFNMSSRSFPSDSDPPVDNYLPDLANTFGTIFEPYDDVEVISQQNYESLSEFLLPMWPLQGDEWEGGNTAQKDPSE